MIASSVKAVVVISASLSCPFAFTLEKAVATYSSTLAWKIPWVEEPSRLQSMGLLNDFIFTFHFHALEK